MAAVLSQVVERDLRLLGTTSSNPKACWHNDLVEFACPPKKVSDQFDSKAVGFELKRSPFFVDFAKKWESGRAFFAKSAIFEGAE